MLIDVKPEVRNLLLANTDLVTALGGDNVYSVLAPDGAQYPYITLQEVGNDGIDYGDDSPTRADIRIQVDIWSSGNYTQLASLVDDTISPLRYVRYYSTDMFELAPPVFHKVLRYWVAKELG